VQEACAKRIEKGDRQEKTGGKAKDKEFEVDEAS
jgi:hypothetical protein